MITKIYLDNFKSFVKVAIKLGPLTSFIGTNASGKSNIKDALRILHGISRGFTLAEAIGEKYGEGGVPLWKGIRGGSREMIFSGNGAKECRIGIEFRALSMPKLGSGLQSKEFSGVYWLTIALDHEKANAPKVLSEGLRIHGYDSKRGYVLFRSRTENKVKVGEPHQLSSTHKKYAFRNDIPALTQLVDHASISEEVKAYVYGLIYLLRKMRFLDVSPEAMRQPSLPGQIKLSDRGENLSSVLQAICFDEDRKKLLLKWLRELSPQEVVDFEFSEDTQGKVVFHLVESNGRKTSAYSASDGTLRFLATVVALLSPESAMFYFLEEIENGIHPSRLHLLVRLMEQRAANSEIQLVLTSHSPFMLDFLSEQSLQNLSIIYRLPARAFSEVKSVVDIPDFDELHKNKNVSEMHLSNWFENILEFMDEE